MPDFLLALLYGAAVGLMIPLGGALARIERLQPRWLEQEFRHSMIALAAGILVSAVAFVLVPDGLELLPLGPGLAAFFAGGALFVLIERRRKARGRAANAQLSAMLTDFVPEALALGALMATGSGNGALLAFFIGAQNLPEAFNAFREMMAHGKRSAARVTGAFFALAAVGPIAAAVGFLFLSELPALTGSIMLAAAGGILFLTFEDIAVKAHLKYSEAPSLAALAGFGLGIVAMSVVGAGAP